MAAEGRLQGGVAERQGGGAKTLLPQGVTVQSRLEVGVA